jgi:hypothetical protein
MRVKLEINVREPRDALEAPDDGLASAERSPLAD